jgi:hypothetical protein
MSASNPKWVEIYRAENGPEAHMMRMALEEAGVPVRIEGELLRGVAGRLPMGWDTAPRILTEESQESVARNVMAQVQVRKHAEPQEDETEGLTRCLACGRMMTEAEVKCSSCGWSFQDQMKAEPSA